jgi:hypothetical protein
MFMLRICPRFRISIRLQLKTVFIPLFIFLLAPVLSSAQQEGNGLDGVSDTPQTNDSTPISVSVLPVHVQQFIVQKNAKQVDLHWTASIAGAGGQFVVEKSTDGKNFLRLGTVGIPPVSGSFSYSFTDTYPSDGKNFYRIRIEELFSVVRHTLTVMANMKDQELYGAFPTITSADLFIKVPAPSRIIIYNSQGMKVKSLKVGGSQHIDVKDLVAGTYHVLFEGKRETVRFIKM